MKFFFFQILMLATTLASCESARYQDNVIDSITSSYSKRLYKNEGLELIGSGGTMMHDIESVELHYCINKNVDVNSARKLFVNSVEGLVTEINKDVKIRPYLHEYPFTHHNAEVKISFYGQDNRFVIKPYIAYVSEVLP